MQHSHNTTHAFEASSFSLRAYPISEPKLGLPAVVSPHSCLPLSLPFSPFSNDRAEYSSLLPHLFFKQFSFEIVTTKRYLRNALASRAQVAVEAIANESESKAAGAIANATLNAPQSNREVTKTKIAKTPYPEARPAQKDRAAASEINFQTQISTRMRQAAS